MFPDTILQKPNSMDPVEWLVYADNQADLGNAEKEQYARNVARGLEKYPRGLFLAFIHSIGGTLGKCQAGVCLPGHRDGKSPPVCDEKSPLDYFWDISPVQNEYTSRISHTPISPINKPLSLQKRPDLVLSFWDKLAELGSSSL